MSRLPRPDQAQLLVATTNPDKLGEIRTVLRGLPWSIESLSHHRDLPEPEETGATFAENARLKALYYANATGAATVADDSGLAIDALGGRPGVRSARYDGDTYAERFTNLYRELETTCGSRDSSVRFVCALALVWRGQIVFTARGVVEGRVAPVPRGTQGFGYDPIFYYPPLGVTLGELDRDQKTRISHRGQAFRALRAFLKSWRPTA